MQPQDHVLRPSDLGDGSTFQMLYQARTDLALKNIDLAKFFANCIDRLQVGDRVEVCVYADKRWDRLLETRTARVTDETAPRGSSGRRVMLEWVTEAQVFGQGAAAQAATTQPEAAKYRVLKEFGAGFNVVDDKGNVVEKLKTKAEADAYADRMNGKAPEAKAPAKTKAEAQAAA